MKKLNLFIAIAIVFMACSKDEEKTNTQENSITISMGTNYTNDVYYSFTDGVVATANRTEWDIAFHTNPRSGAILTNDGKGIKLFIADATENWDNVNSKDGLSALYNSYIDSTWQYGAFNNNITGVFDYGWATYSITDHTLTGDSVHIIELADGSLKRLLIEKRDGQTNDYHIKYANLDGSNVVSEIINTRNYTDKNFVYYSIENKMVVDHEPLSTSWDILFTKYYDESQSNIVTGILNNTGIEVSKILNSNSENNDFENQNYSNVISSIGSDWKTYNMTTHSLSLVPDLIYFIKDNSDSYHQLHFTDFEGKSTGNIEFITKSY